MDHTHDGSKSLHSPTSALWYHNTWHIIQPWRNVGHQRCIPFPLQKQHCITVAHSLSHYHISPHRSSTPYKRCEQCHSFCCHAFCCSYTPHPCPAGPKESCALSCSCPDQDSCENGGKGCTWCSLPSPGKCIRGKCDLTCGGICPNADCRGVKDSNGVLCDCGDCCTKQNEALVDDLSFPPFKACIIDECTKDCRGGGCGRGACGAGCSSPGSGSGSGSGSDSAC
jgi:hypothetical protein